MAAALCSCELSSGMGTDSPRGRAPFPPSIFPADGIDPLTPKCQSRITGVGVVGESDRTRHLSTLTDKRISQCFRY